MARSDSYPEPRPVNIDPGYLNLGKFLLATTKDQAHRVYLRDGVYAEVTLRYQAGAFEPWPSGLLPRRLSPTGRPRLPARSPRPATMTGCASMKSGECRMKTSTSSAPSSPLPTSLSPRNAAPRSCARVLLGATTRPAHCARMIAPGEDPGLLQHTCRRDEPASSSCSGCCSRRRPRPVGGSGRVRATGAAGWSKWPCSSPSSSPSSAGRNGRHVQAPGAAHRLGLARPVCCRLSHLPTGRLCRRPTGDARRLSRRGRARRSFQSRLPGDPRRSRVGGVCQAGTLCRLAGPVPPGVDRDGDRLSPRPRPRSQQSDLHRRLRGFLGVAAFAAAVLSAFHAADATNPPLLDTWRATLNLIRDRPWLGVGAGNFSRGFRLQEVRIPATRSRTLAISFWRSRPLAAFSRCLPC